MQEVIQHDIVDPHIIKNSRDTSDASFFWRKLGNGCEATAKILVAVQGVISFGAAAYSMPMLGFISGSVSIVAMSLFGYSSYSMSESKERTVELNMLLRHAGIREVPNIAIDSTEMQSPYGQPKEEDAKLEYPIESPSVIVEAVEQKNNDGI